MQLLQGISIGEVEFIALRGLKVRIGLPEGPLSWADGQAFKGKSQPILHSDSAAHRRGAGVFRVVRTRRFGEEAL